MPRQFSRLRPLNPVPDLPNEEWRPVAACPSYAVSSLGRVKRVKAGRTARAGRLLKPKPCGRARGYRQIALHCPEGEIQYRSIHTLVLAAFVGPPPSGLQVNHIDGDKTNNHLANLEYVTPKQNMAHAEAHGLMNRQPFRGPHPWAAKLTEDQVRAIRVLPGTQAAIARRFGVTQSLVSMIRSRQIWTHI